MRRAGNVFQSNAQDREQNRFIRSQMYSPQYRNTPAHPDSPITEPGRHSATAPNVSQSVTDHLKELRAMSSSDKDLNNVSFGNGSPHQRNVCGLEASGRVPDPHSRQHYEAQGPQRSSVPFCPPVPPPPFHPSLPPPGLQPFHSPPPGLQPGNRNAMFSCPPPPLPQQASRPIHPHSQFPGVPVPANPVGSTHLLNAGNASALAGSTRPPAVQSNFRMASPSGGISTPGQAVGLSSAAPQAPFLQPPPLPGRLPAPDSPVTKKSPSGSTVHLGHSSLSTTSQTTVSECPGMDRDASSTYAQQEVDRWLQKRGKRKVEGAASGSRHGEGGTRPPLGTDPSNKDITLRIGEAHNILRNVLHALAAVQGEVQQLEELQETADDRTWESCVSKITQLKETYLETKQKVDTDRLKNLKRKLDLRRKKRERKKRQRQEEKETEEQLQFERAQKHAAIDQWREKLQQDDLNRQQMKRMKETADKTLSKVRKEIREAGKMLDTVTRLQKLRAIRNDTAEKRGQTFPPSVEAHFTEKTSDLIQLLTQQMQAFQKEEAALELILETENEEAKEKEKEEKRRKQREIRLKEMYEEKRSLFGVMETPCLGDPMLPFAQYYMQSQCSLQALQNIRGEWDKFLVPETTPMASRIPDSWVNPEPPSSSVWASVLQSS